MKSLFKLLNDYKYKGDYLDNSNLLIEIIDKLKSNLKEHRNKELEIFAIHLVLEVRNYRLGMAYSKSYEMAGQLEMKIKNETIALIRLLNDNIQIPLLFLMEELIPNKDIIIKNKITTWISLFSPWNFYLIENKDKKVLSLLDMTNDVNEISYDLNSYESLVIDKNEKHWEQLYGIVDKIRTRKLIENETLK